MKSPSKPDSGQVKSCVSELSLLLNQLKSVQSSAPKLEKALRAALASARKKPLQAALSKINVDELSRDKLNVRLSALHDAGIHDMWQLYNTSADELTRIEGIGPQSAKRIRKSAEALASATEKTLRLRVSVSDESPENRALILALYRWVQAKPLCEQANNLLNGHERRMRSAMSDVRPLQNPLGRLLTFGKRKEKAGESWEYLRRQHAGAFSSSATEIILRFRTLLAMPPQQCLAEFERDAATYIAALDAYLLQVKEPGKNYLAAELVEEIEQVQPDLHLLKATLRSYQLFGCKYILHQNRVLLGDEMGLGKTVQAIAVLAAQAAAGKSRSLVLCPASVLINWRREIEQHSLLTAITLHGYDRDSAFAQWMERGGVAVTTYETCQRLAWPENVQLDMLVVDEAHYAKNPRARRTKSVQMLTDAAGSVLFMTGTPLENKVQEMCNLVGMLNFGVSEDLKKHTALASAQKFRETLAPVYLRRVREDVLTELPDLIEKEQWCEMGKAEKNRYSQAVRAGNFADMRRVSWHVEDINDCSKARRLLEICDTARENRRKVIVFSFFLHTLERIESLLQDRCAGKITGANPPAERQSILDGFRDAPDGSVLACQILAGGTGLNIQTASVVIFCEPQLKPSLETQAIARAYRMGQVRDVLVYRLLCEKSVDEQILQLLAEKQQQFDSFADESVIREAQLQFEQASAQTIIAAEQERLLTEKEAS